MTLFFYVLKDFFKYVFGTILLTLFLFILFDFIHKTTKYIPTHQPETKHLVLYYVYQSPNLIVQALPIAALLASVVCMVLLSRTNEITAMRAAGMGPLRIGAPIATGGIILSLCSMGIGEGVLPYSAQKMHYVEQVLIKKESETQIAEGARWLRQGSTLYNFRDYDPISKTMTGVRVIHTGKNFRPKRTIEAVSASYREGTKDWLLSDVAILYFWPNGTLSYSENKPLYTLTIPAEPKKLKRERRQPNELSVRELAELIDRGNASGADVASYKVDMNIKFAFHFASFVVSLIGLKFGYRSERSMETARSVLMAIAIGVSYWFILNTGRALGKRGTLPPFFSAWLANIVVFGISCVSILRARKN